MSKFDETCSMCGREIVVSVFQHSTLCPECLSTKKMEDSRPTSMPSAVAGVKYERLPDGFRVSADARSFKYLIGLTALLLFWGLALRTPNKDASVYWILAGGTLLSVPQAIVGLLGVVRLERAGTEFFVYTGVGAIGSRKTYDWADFTSVHERSVGEGNEQQVVLDGGRRVSFGHQLSDEQRYFVREVLRMELARSRAK